MAIYDNISFQDVKNLPPHEKTAILQVLTKRANSRITALKNEELNTRALKKAQRFLDKQDSDKFYQGKKYKNNREIDSTLKQVISFLSDDTSRIPRKKSEPTQKKKRERTKIYTFEQISGASYDKKLKASQDMAKLANRRMRDLEKNGYQGGAYKVAVHDLGGKNRFYTGDDFKSEKQLDLQLRQLDWFLHKESSTVGGFKAIDRRRIETLRRNGVNIPKGSEKLFIQFLKDEQFKELCKSLDSEQVLDDFADALNYIIQDFTTMDEIQRRYEDYLNDEDGKTFDVYRRERDLEMQKKREERTLLK